MIRKADKAALDICGRLDLRGVEYRRMVSIFSRIRSAHVRMFLDLMFGSVQDNHGFDGIAHWVPMGDKK